MVEVGLESTNRHLGLAEDDVNLMRENGHIQGPQLCKLKAARVAAEESRRSPESSVQLLIVSDSAWQGKVTQLSRRVEDIGEEVVRMRQECNHNGEDVLSRGMAYKCVSIQWFHSSQSLVAHSLRRVSDSNSNLDVRSQPLAA